MRRISGSPRALVHVHSGTMPSPMSNTGEMQEQEWQEGWTHQGEEDSHLRCAHSSPKGVSGSPGLLGAHFEKSTNLEDH